MRLSGEDIAQLAEALEGSAYTTLKVEAASFSLLLTKGTASWSAETVQMAENPVAAETAADEEEYLGPAIRAPMVGVFYHAPKPGDPPFVGPGSQVGPHSVVGIIETMKLMNSITAGQHGRVTEIIVPDATFVEAGAVLMRIEPVQP